MSFFKRTISFCLCLLLLLSCAAAGLAVSADSYNWAGAWGTPTVKSGVTIGSKLGNGIQLRDFIPANSTVRTVITTTLGGIKIRLKFSNLHGTEAITIDETTIAKTAADKEKVLTDTITPVTFNNGEKAVTIAAGSEVYSDEIDFVCDYYSYAGKYEDSYLFGEPWTYHADAEIGDVYLHADRVSAMYRFTDIYGQNYWTPAIP